MTSTRELLGRSAIVAGGPAAPIAGLGLAAAGARVTVATETGETAAADIRASGAQARALAVRPDVEADWERLFETAASSFGAPDIVVFAAGAFAPHAIADLPVSDFNRLARTGLKAAFFCVKHAAAAMRRAGRGGTIALVGDLAARLGVRDGPHHAVIQGGVRMLTKSAALELGPEGIRVNAVLAGPPGDPAGPEAPLGRSIAPRDIAEAVLFLASDRSRFMTGAEIVLDGGWSIQ